MIYSLSIELPGKERDNLISHVNAVCDELGLKKRRYLPHISIKSGFLATSERFCDDLDIFVRKQVPFLVRLNELKLFSNEGEDSFLLYLGTENQKEVKELTNLHNGVEKIIKSNNWRFSPHVSLIDWAPVEKIIEAEHMLQRRIHPVDLIVDELVLKREISPYYREKYKTFSLEGKEIYTNDSIRPRSISTSS